MIGCQRTLQTLETHAKADTECCGPETLPPNPNPAQVEDRFSPAWWFADVPQEAIAPLHDLNNVLPFLQQVRPLEPSPTSQDVPLAMFAKP